ncbi:hypothetical protein AN216_11600 [Streptomyces oceani]|uniref:Uncharacterized protein n=1 Tax=Streptomyces oceani TaxID=1075402 RepID=A0A1E7KHU8_9ACTN|nr:hypothetical protein AN216_11600 [Streptomyces oceani]
MGRTGAGWPGRAHDEVSAELPDEDLADDLGETLEQYVEGSKPRCEEAEYLELLREAMERFDRER